MSGEAKQQTRWEMAAYEAAEYFRTYLGIKQGDLVEVVDQNQARKGPWIGRVNRINAIKPSPKNNPEKDFTILIESVKRDEGEYRIATFAKIMERHGMKIRKLDKLPEGF